MCIRDRFAVLGPRGEEAAVLDRTSGLEELAARTFQGVVPGVVAAPAHWHGVSDRFGLRRDDRRDAALLEPTEDLCVGVARISRNGLHGGAGRRLDRID